MGDDPSCAVPHPPADHHSHGAPPKPAQPKAQQPIAFSPGRRSGGSRQPSPQGAKEGERLEKAVWGSLPSSLVCVKRNQQCLGLSWPSYRRCLPLFSLNILRFIPPIRPTAVAFARDCTPTYQFRGLNRCAIDSFHCQAGQQQGSGNMSFVRNSHLTL